MTSCRAADAPVAELEEHHRSDAFDHSGIAADRNLGLPLDRLHELAAAADRRWRLTAGRLDTGGAS